MKRITNALLDPLCAEARTSPRKRVNFNLHEGPRDSVQRFLNVMQPGTYVRPHRHNGPVKWELSVVLSGRLAFLIFDADGRVLERIELAADGPDRGLELPAGTWHSSVVMVPDTVLLEVKRGPYDELSDKEFARWAPPEGDAACPAVERWFRTARPGDSYAA